MNYCQSQAEWQKSQIVPLEGYRPTQYGLYVNECLTHSMKVLARPGCMRADRTTAITYTRNFTHRIHPASQSESYPLGRPPVSIIPRELREVPKFKLQRRHLSRGGETAVILGRNSFAPLEVHHREWEPRGGIERGKNAVREVTRAFEVESVASGVVVRRKKAAKHAGCSLHDKQ